MKDDKPMEIHPQKCYGCNGDLKDGDRAAASMEWPIAFCLKCRVPGHTLAPAVVKGERDWCSGCGAVLAGTDGKSQPSCSNCA